jgi:hypothetical protein
MKEEGIQTPRKRNSFKWEVLVLPSMVRKDQIREGFVARTFHIPIDVDDKLRMEAVKQRIRFSDMAVIAFNSYLQKVSRVIDKE